MSCDTSLGEVAPPLPTGAFSMLLSAKPASGKSTFLENILGKKSYYKKKFDNVYVFCPPSSIASLPNKSVIKNHDKIYDDLTLGNLDKVYQKCLTSSKEEENTLIVIDDLLHALKNNDILKLLEHIFCNRRHLRTSCIISTQVYNSLPLILRKCLSHAVVWKLGNGKEKQSVMEELFAGQPKDIAERVLHLAHKERHDFLICDLQNGRFHNSDLDEIVISD